MIWLALQLGCHPKDDAPPDGAADADTDTDADTDADVDADTDTDTPTVPPATGTLVVNWAIAGQQGTKTCTWGDDDYFPSWPSLGTIWSLDCTDPPDFGFFATHQPDVSWPYTADDVHLSLQDIGGGIDTAALTVASQSVSVDEVDASIPSVKGSFSVTYTDGSTLDGSFDTYLAP